MISVQNRKLYQTRKGLQFTPLHLSNYLAQGPGLESSHISQCKEWIMITYLPFFLPNQPKFTYVLRPLSRLGLLSSLVAHWGVTLILQIPPVDLEETKSLLIEQQIIKINPAIRNCFIKIINWLNFAFVTEWRIIAVKKIHKFFFRKFASSKKITISARITPSACGGIIPNDVDCE